LEVAAMTEAAPDPDPAPAPPPAERGTPIQHQIPDNFCWGCGAANPDGLHLKSYWDGETSTATYVPDAAFAAGPPHVLNGGIIATLLDCFGVCAAIASAYDHEHRAIGSSPEIWHATTSLSVDYLRPTPIGEPVELEGRVTNTNGLVVAVTCSLHSAGKERARAVVHSVRVPEEWRHGRR
jgi:acyl-coenzyme A thioesterase PaaI-like protein